MAMVGALLTCLLYGIEVVAQFDAGGTPTASATPFAVNSIGTTGDNTPTNNSRNVGSTVASEGLLEGPNSYPNNTLPENSRVINPPADLIRSKFPNCPMLCLDAMHGDGWCNTECAIPECGNDGEDCKGWCAPDCKPGWIGDKFCDKDCYRKECNWDGEDCDHLFERKSAAPVLNCFR